MSGGDAPVDREAVFVALFDAYYEKILAYATRRLGRCAAEEAVADTFITAWTDLDSVTGEPLLWLYGIARGAVANHRRRLQRSTRLEERARFLSPVSRGEDPADVVVWEDTFAAAMAQLAEPDREVLRLVAWEGLTAPDAAAVMGCSAIACKVRLHRARQRLSRYLRMDLGPTRHRAGTAPPSAGSDAGGSPQPEALPGGTLPARTGRSSTEPPSWPPVVPQGRPC